MKKLLCTLLAIFLTVPAFGYFKAEKVFASGGYEVAYIQDDGSFKTVATYSDFGSAKTKMKENEDYVVRHNNSFSPSKIIAMNSGLVYTYPYRRGYSTMNVYEKVNSSLVGTGVTTYLAEHYEMTYHSTYYYYESKGYGYVEVTMNGFHGYCDLEYTDLVPTKYIEKNIPITLGGGDITGSDEQPFSVKIKQNYYYVNEHDGYRDLVFCYHRAWSKTNGGDCLESKVTIGVAPEFMKKGVNYYSNDGVNFYKDGKLSEKVGTYYNYYQFLPLRTKTNISSDTMNAFLNKNAGSNSVIKGEASSFVNAQNKYGCNAATILSMAIHESAWGTSNIARGKNNLFGWGAFDDATSNATRYDSIASCVNAQMADNLANYMDVKSSRYFSMSLGNKGGGFITKYASDPYWAEKIAGIYYSLDKYSGGNTKGKLTDYGTYKLGLVKTTKADIKNAINGSTILNTANKTGYQKNIIIAILSEDSGYLKFNTANPIKGKEIIYPIELPYGTLVDYNYDDSIGYIKSSDVIVLDNGATISSDNEMSTPINPIKPDEIIDPANLKTMSYIESFDIKDSKIRVSGFGLIKGINFNDPTKVKHQAVFKNANDTDDEIIIDLETIKESLELGDGHAYDYVYFNGDINISELNLGSYYVYLRIINGSNNADVSMKNTESNFNNKVVKVGENTVRLTTDQVYSYRFELDVENTPIDYASINKPKIRSSLFVLNKIELTDDLRLLIDGTGIIREVDYKNSNDVTFNIYLVRDGNDYKKVTANTLINEDDYKTALNTTKDLTYSRFNAEIDISDLVGNYDLILEINVKNGSKVYKDYIYMFEDDLNTIEVTNNDLDYRVTKSHYRNRIVLMAGIEKTIKGD